MIRCVVFDFDGTLVHSNAIKRDGFLAVAARHPGGVEIMEDILADPPGDRHAIIGRFAARIGADGEAARLVEDYGRYCTEHILTCPARAGADTALAALRRARLRLHINSATPTEPLREVIARRYASGTFDGVHGGFGAKVVNLRSIVEIEGIGPAEMAMVGDGIDDRNAADETGVHFFGVAEGTLAEATGGDGLISDLGALPQLIASR